MLLGKAQTTKDTKIRLPRVVAISSGKGGVGKSSITVNLAISLAKDGSRVCVLDADTGLANANILLGLVPKYSLEHVLFNAKKIEDVMLEGPCGMKIIPGANGISECVDLHPRQQLRLTRELARIENAFDYILVDTAAGIANTTLDFVCASQYSLIVITPEPTSLTDAFSMVKLLSRRRRSVSYHVVVNMCRDEDEYKEVFRRFYSAVKKYIGIDVETLGFIPTDEAMRSAVVAQNPVVMINGHSPSSRGFSKLAKDLKVNSTKSPAPKSFSAYWYGRFKQRHQQETKGANYTSPRGGESDHLSELRAEIISLIEHGKADSQSVKLMIQESMDAYIKRYDSVPVDLLGLIDTVVSASSQDHRLLRDIAEQVQPWVDAGVGAPQNEELYLRSVKAVYPTSYNRGDSFQDLSCAKSNDSNSEGKGLGVLPILPVDNSHHEVMSEGPEVVLEKTVTKIGTKKERPLIAHTDHQKADIGRIFPTAGVRSESSYAPNSIGQSPHLFSVKRFGSQECLVEKLRKSDANGQTIEEFLATLTL